MLRDPLKRIKQIDQAVMYHNYARPLHVFVTSRTRNAPKKYILTTCKINIVVNFEKYGT